jgi:hypothetical protein
MPLAVTGIQPNSLKGNTKSTTPQVPVTFLRGFFMNATVV